MVASVHPGISHNLSPEKGLKDPSHENLPKFSLRFCIIGPPSLSPENHVSPKIPHPLPTATNSEWFPKLFA